MAQDYDYDSPASVRYISDFQISSRSPSIGDLEVARSCRLTDWMSCVPFPSSLSLISDRLRDILQTARLAPHAFYQTSISKPGKPPVRYWALHVPQALTIPDDASPLAAGELIGKDTVLGGADLFRIILPIRYSAWFITSRLRDQLIAEGMTGIRYGRGKLRAPPVS